MILGRVDALTPDSGDERKNQVGDLSFLSLRTQILVNEYGSLISGMGQRQPSQLIVISEIGMHMRRKLILLQLPTHK